MSKCTGNYGGFEPAIPAYISATAPTMYKCIYLDDMSDSLFPQTARTAAEPKNKEQQEKHNRLPQSSKSRHVSTEFPLTSPHTDTHHSLNTSLIKLTAIPHILLL